MKKPPSLAAVWLLAGVLMAWALLWEGTMIGGVKYFGHVGMGASALLQLGLILASFSIALASAFGPNAVRPMASMVAIGALLFAASFFPFLPFFLAAPLSYVSPRIFPGSNAGCLLPFLVAVLAFYTRAEYASLDSKLELSALVDPSLITLAMGRAILKFRENQSAQEICPTCMSRIQVTTNGTHPTSGPQRFSTACECGACVGSFHVPL